MKKEEVESILLVNLYLTNCKLLRPFSPITALVRSYLCKKINTLLDCERIIVKPVVKSLELVK